MIWHLESVRPECAARARGRRTVSRLGAAPGCAAAGRHYPGAMRSAGAALADFCCVLLFVVIGRANHHDGGSLAGLWHTFWPFAAGAAAGMLATRFWRRPLAVVPTGLGMTLRVLVGQGTAFAFILVALAFLGLFQLGWRLVWQWAAPRLMTVDPKVRSH
jgi:hypothetical protein